MLVVSNLADIEDLLSSIVGMLGQRLSGRGGRQTLQTKTVVGHITLALVSAALGTQYVAITGRCRLSLKEHESSCRCRWQVFPGAFLAVGLRKLPRGDG